MLALIDKNTNEFIKEVKEGTWAELGLKKLVSPAEAGWEDDSYKLLPLNKFTPPAGNVRYGPRLYTIYADHVDEHFEFVPEEPVSDVWEVSTYRIVRRIEEAGKTAEANALLDSSPALKFRFLTVGHVMSNDENMLQALTVLGLDPDVILAKE